MKVAPPNLRMLAKRNGGKFPRTAVEAYIDGTKQVASHGDRLMPIWGDFLQSDNKTQDPVRRRIASLADFIERLQYR
jgi:hypothetical protein